MNKTTIALLALLLVIPFASSQIYFIEHDRGVDNSTAETCDLSSGEYSSYNGTTFLCDTPAGGGAAGGWEADATHTNTTLIVNIDGMYLCNNGTHGIITVNETYATTYC